MRPQTFSDHTSSGTDIQSDDDICQRINDTITTPIIAAQRMVIQTK